MKWETDSDLLRAIKRRIESDHQKRKRAFQRVMRRPRKRCRRQPPPIDHLVNFQVVYLERTVVEIQAEILQLDIFSLTWTASDGPIEPKRINRTNYPAILDQVRSE